MLINSTMGSFCNVYVIIYQIITLCTINILQSYLSIIFQ